MNIEILDGYDAAVAPDKLRLQELIRRAKGPNRDMKTYAELCGVSASTLSRIATGKINSPITKELLIALFENQDSTADITIGQWARANGLRRRVEKTFDDEQYSKVIEERDRESNIRQTITNSLMDREVLFLKKQSHCISGGQKTYSTWEIAPSLSIYLKEEDYYWDFIFFLEQFNEDEYKQLGEHGFVLFKARRFVQRVSLIFLLDVWDPGRLEKEKITFVFFDERLMDGFIEYLQIMQFKNKFSIVLANRKGDTIIKETNLRGEEDKGSIFLREVVMDDGNKLKQDEFRQL